MKNKTEFYSVITVSALCMALIMSCVKVGGNIPVSFVSVNPPMAEMIIGEQTQLKAVVSPSDATDAKIIWSSSRQSIATVSPSGLVTATGEGTAEIYASAGEKKGECSIRVKKPSVSSVSLNKTELVLFLDETFQLEATILPPGASNTISWASSNKNVVSVTDGLIKGIKEGDATITAKCGERSAQCYVNVKKKVISVTSVSITPTSLRLTGNTSATLTATVNPADATERTVIWSSNAPAVASVNEGYVSAGKKGIATITASCGDKSATCTVKVVGTVPSGAVDLGLDVFWASCNIGASHEYEYGSYYAWGEINTKSSYSITNYRWWKYNDTTEDVIITKYNPTDLKGGPVDNLTQLLLEDDVANYKLKGNWRIPTRDECQELINNCTYSVTTVNGKKGLKFTSKIEGFVDRSIFFPFCGIKQGSYFEYAGENGYYWSSSLDLAPPDDAYPLRVFVRNNYPNTSANFSLLRSDGISIRPVCD